MRYSHRLIEICLHEGPAGLLERIVKRYHLLRLNVHKFIGTKEVKSRYGPSFQMNYCDMTYRYYIQGAYGQFFWQRISKYPNKFIFLDIGANQGLYAIGACQNENCLASYAFEPVSATFELLEKNILINAVSDRCTPFAVAIGENSGPAEIRTGHAHSGKASLAQSRQTSGDLTCTERIEVIDGRQLAEIIVETDKPIVVKIDVEGYETVVIKQLIESSLGPIIAELFFEVDERWINKEEVFRFLKSSGFKDIIIQGKGVHYDVLAVR